MAKEEPARQYKCVYSRKAAKLISRESFHGSDDGGGVED